MSTVFLGSTKHISLWYTFTGAIPYSGKAGIQSRQALKLIAAYSTGRMLLFAFFSFAFSI